VVVPLKGERNVRIEVNATVRELAEGSLLLQLGGLLGILSFPSLAVCSEAVERVVGAGLEIGSGRGGWSCWARKARADGEESTYVFAVSHDCGLW